jgi:hypothetical protein
VELSTPPICLHGRYFTHTRRTSSSLADIAVSLSVLGPEAGYSDQGLFSCILPPVCPRSWPPQSVRFHGLPESSFFLCCPNCALIQQPLNKLQKFPIVSACLHTITLYPGHTKKNGAVLIVFTIKTAPFLCVCPVYNPLRMCKLLAGHLVLYTNINKPENQ